VGQVSNLSYGFDAALRHYQHALIYALRYNRFLLDEVLSGRPQGTPLRPILPECLKRGECSSPCAMGGRRARTASARGEGTAKITATETESDQTTCTPVREAAPSQGTPLYTAPGEQWALAIWGDRIVWIDGRKGDLYLSDLSTLRRELRLRRDFGVSSVERSVEPPKRPNRAGLMPG